VDNHKFRRLHYEVLEHDPTNEDIMRFFRRFKQMVDAHELTLKDITTDGSPLYPEPIAEVFCKVKHQSCQFHVIKEITRNILKVVTQVSRQLTVCPHCFAENSRLNLSEPQKRPVFQIPYLITWQCFK